MESGPNASAQTSELHTRRFMLILNNASHFTDEDSPPGLVRRIPARIYSLGTIIQMRT